jgi:hypothetical protein
VVTSSPSNAKAAHVVYKTQMVAQTMFAQALMCHNSQLREHALDQDVRQSESFQLILEDLQLAHYFEAAKLKHEQYLQLIGNASCAEALEATDDQFNQLLTHHTHGLSKEMFWGYHAAAKQALEHGDGTKAQHFLAKSNGTVSFLPKGKKE